MPLSRLNFYLVIAFAAVGLGSLIGLVFVPVKGSAATGRPESRIPNPESRIP
jgi:hypothetical protein